MTPITITEYIGPHADCPDWTTERRINAELLLARCADLQAEMEADGIVFEINPSTGCNVGGQTMGGFRPQMCSVGAPNSAHKQGMAVDRYDPHGHIDDWLLEHQDALERHGIYIEHPSATTGWSHWSIKPPASGRHVFYP